MGIEQNIEFEYKLEDLTQLLESLDYEVQDLGYIKQDSNFTIELYIEDTGLVIHRSGHYFSEFGLLIEKLGLIASSIKIEDK